ncbi:hypothetical protein [Streptomyces sp. NPDC052036]|uniref:hypothetical protein n=1 Tax=unclassified Streptomyces TaxID=2593676 RepID=UPI00343072F1
MSHTFGRRAATALLTVTAAVGTLFAAGGFASAAPNPAADRPAVVVSHAQGVTEHGGDHNGSGRDSWSDNRGNGGDGRNDQRSNQGDRDSYRGDSYSYRVSYRSDDNSYRASYRSDRDHDGRGDHREFRGERRWDGHRYWNHEGRYWYCDDDHGWRYRYDGHHFYRWDRGVWVIVISDTHGFDFDGALFR